MSENAATCNADAADTPAARVVRVLGWPLTCELADLTPSAVMKWDRPLRTKGGGGLVPARYQARFLRAARERRLPLTADDLIAEPR